MSCSYPSLAQLRSFRLTSHTIHVGQKTPRAVLVSVAAVSRASQYVVRPGVALDRACSMKDKHGRTID